MGIILRKFTSRKQRVYRLRGFGEEWKVNGDDTYTSWKRTLYGKKIRRTRRNSEKRGENNEKISEGEEKDGGEKVIAKND